ncbi:hypothetical protein V500_00879 [Pseudogymnoascus sp. VKM F-4518 (FW-2643)]|nr:hypothetical protein V500_00879 [Pseudogymnoascus sp. VKM F-4518 (FW-2643)]
MATSPGAARASSLEAANQLAGANPEAFVQWRLARPLTSNESIGVPPSPPAPAFSAPASVSPAPSAVSSVVRACVRLLRAAKSGRGRKRVAGPTRIEARWRVEGVGVSFAGGGCEGGADVATTTLPPLCCSGGGVAEF